MKESFCFSGTIEITEQDPFIWAGSGGTPLLPLASLDDKDRYFVITASVRITNLEDVAPEVTLSDGVTSCVQSIATHGTLTCALRADRNWATSINLALLGVSAADIGTTAEYTLVVQEV